MTTLKPDTRVSAEFTSAHGFVVSVKRAKGRVLALVNWESGADAGKQSWESVRDLRTL